MCLCAQLAADADRALPLPHSVSTLLPFGDRIPGLTIDYDLRLDFHRLSQDERPPQSPGSR